MKEKKIKTIELIGILATCSKIANKKTAIGWSVAKTLNNSSNVAVHKQFAANQNSLIDMYARKVDGQIQYKNGEPSPMLANISFTDEHAFFDKLTDIENEEVIFKYTEASAKELEKFREEMHEPSLYMPLFGTIIPE